MANTVVGFYGNRELAQQVVQDLHSQGFGSEHIDVISDASDNLTDRLTQVGAPKDEAQRFAEGVRQGGSIVAVTTDEAKAARAAQIMRGYDGGMTTQQQASSRADGQSNMAQNADRMQGQTGDGQVHIPVVEEEIQIGKREVDKGGVRVQSYVVETPVQEQVRLREENVHVDRRPVDRPVSGSDSDLFREKTIELNETTEEAVVAKSARIVEEVVVSKDVNERVETVQDTVRRTDVEVERLDSGHPTSGMQLDDYDRHDPDFRQHFETNYRGKDSYAQIQPAYRYGYTMASDPRYRGRDWSDIEKDARRDWESKNQGSWDRVGANIRYAWERARGQGSR